MSKINEIQNAILELEGGAYQKLLDAYLYKKYNYHNIQTLGVQVGTNKVTIGIPDSYVDHGNGTYTLIMYGTVEQVPYQKLKEDILSCIDRNKLEFKKENIHELICAYTSPNLRIEQREALKELIPGVDINLIGLSTVSHDILVHFPELAVDFLNIPILSGQITNVNNFIVKHDSSETNAPLTGDLLFRDKELESLTDMVNKHSLVLLSGNAGVGKTKLAIEASNVLENEGYKVYCMKNHNAPIFRDLRLLFSKPGKYLLFIDDANEALNLDYIFEFVSINNQKENINIKLLLTVRDYAKASLELTVSKYFKYKVMNINALDRESIKEILVRNTGIKNNDYLEQIIKIAKGNPRLAILAAKATLRDGYKAIANAEDIFENYYGTILTKQKLENQKVYVLFIISLFGKLLLNKNKLALKLSEYFNVSENDFTVICHQLNDLELINIHYDEIVSISDQSFGNYILKYVLIDKKFISIIELLEMGFPEFKERIIYSLNTLVAIFHSDYIADYISIQINKSWDRADDDLQDAYLECFYPLNQEKSLQKLKQSIDKMDYQKVSSIDVINFEKQKNHNRIRSKEIELLSGFKYTDNFEEAMGLLLYLFNKREDLFMDLYFCFSDRLAFDKHSHKYDYGFEYKIIKFLWDKTNGGETKVQAYLILNVCKELLKCRFHKTVGAVDGKAFTMTTFNLVLTKGLKELRNLLWSILAQIYERDLFKEEIESILSAYHGSGMNDVDYKDIFQFDLECIEELFISNWGNCLSFEQCLIMSRLVQFASQLKIDYNREKYNRYETSDKFVIYTVMSKSPLDYKNAESREVANDERLRDLKEFTRTYTLEDYRNLFRILKMIENKRPEDSWIVGENLYKIITINKEEQEFIEIIDVYFSENAPYAHHFPNFVEVLLEQIGVKNTERIINKHRFDSRRLLTCRLLEYIPQEKINHSYIEKLLSFLQQEMHEENSIIPSMLSLEKYYLLEESLIKKITNMIIEISERNPHVVSDYFRGVYHKSDYETIKRIYSIDKNLLQRLYLNSLSIDNYYDYKGDLLIYLIEDDLDFWKSFLKESIKGDIRFTYLDSVFENIWLNNDYKGYIDIAYNLVVSDPLYYLRDETINTLFVKGKKIAKKIKDRQMSWIESYIENNYMEDNKMKTIFTIINIAFEKQKLSFILKALNYIKDAKKFKKIPLFPLSYSFSGSEIPIIDERIEFIENLIDQVKGIEFIEHRAYLKEKKLYLEKRRSEIEKKEFLSEFN